MPKHTSPRQLVDELLGARLVNLSDPAFRVKVQELRAWLDQLEHALDAALQLGAVVQPARRGPGRPRKGSAQPVVVSKRSGRRPGRPRGRKKGGAGEFPATAFILKAVHQAGKIGVVPVELIAQVKKAAPGKHTSPSALVHTILRRLERKGSVKAKRGKWYASA